MSDSLRSTLDRARRFVAAELDVFRFSFLRPDGTADDSEGGACIAEAEALLRDLDEALASLAAPGAREK